MGALLLGLGVVGVVAAAALFASCLRLRGLVAFALAVYLFCTVEVVGIALLLSPTSSLTRRALLLAVAFVLLLALALWGGLGRPRPGFPGLGRTVRHLLGESIVVVLVAGIAISYAYLVLVTLTVPQSVPDTMLYHLPRAALWVQRHAVAYVPFAPQEPINAQPPNAEIQAMFTMSLSRGDRYVGLVQMTAVVVSSLGIFGVARRLGFAVRESAFGALVYPTFTLVAIQSPTALNDLVVAALLITAAFFVTGTGRIELALFALALALALGTKLVTLFALPVLVVFALSSQPRRRWGAVGLAGLLGVVAGSYWYVVNIVETGSFDGGLAKAYPQGGDQTVAGTLGVMRRLGADLLELTTAEGQGRLLRPLWWGLGALVVALVVAVVLAASRRWLAASGVAAGGLFVLVASPMVTVWAEIVGRASRQVASVGGLGSGAPSHAPAGLYESPMHSAYGLAFVFLYLAAVVLAVAARRRGQAQGAVLAALLGVPLFFVAFALPFQYDPQRMRFFAFAVALSAATFGLVLRVRPLAWTAVALSAVTLLVTLGYFVPRPGGLSLLAGRGGGDRTARWFVQGGGGGGDPATFRFLEHGVPASTTLALALVRNTYVYPAWDAGLRRRVLFTPPDGRVPSSADWLVVGPGKRFDPPSGWAPAFASGGWRIYRRGSR